MSQAEPSSELRYDRRVAARRIARRRERFEHLEASGIDLGGSADRERAPGRTESGHHTEYEERAQHHARHPRVPTRRHLLCAPPRHHRYHPATVNYQSPTNLTSGSSQTPLCSLTLIRAISISSRTSWARAPPR